MDGNGKRHWILWFLLCLAGVFLITLAPFGYALPLASQVSQPNSGANRRIGVVKAISGMTITLTPDAGAEVTITVLTATRIVRIAPGEKDLKNAAPIQLQDIQIGDRVLVGGKPSADNQSLEASSIVVMKHSDLEARHAQDLQDWQKRGADGLAKAVDVAGGTVTIAVRGKDLVIHTANSTVFRRYAADSVKFDDAKPSTLQEIHAGDQIRARGNRSADGSELSAEEVVSGSFPLFAGTVNSVDASSSTLNVRDLSTKKNVVVKVTPESQLRQLPPEMAQRIAARLKGAAVGGNGHSGGAGHNGTAGDAQAKPTGDSNSPGGIGDGGMSPRRSDMGGHGGGPPDLQQILSHAPTVSLADLHKGDAVVVLTTDGKEGSGIAIKLFSGVEPILQAAPNAAQAMMLAPWSLGASGGDLGGP
jgi:hypothetical protein